MSEQNNSQYVTRAGAYIGTVEKPANGWFGEAGENQTPYIRIPMRVTEQRDGKNDQVGKVIIWQGWLTDSAVDHTIKSMVEAFPDWDGDLESLYSGDFGFEGLECQIVAESETFKGETRVKAKWLNPVGGGGKPMEAEKVDSLIGRLGRRSKAIAKNVRAEAGGPPTRRSSETSRTTSRSSTLPPPEADDIPF